MGEACRGVCYRPSDEVNEPAVNHALHLSLRGILLLLTGTLHLRE